MSATARRPRTKTRLQERYNKEVLPTLAEKLGRSNRMSLPRLKKIVINMGVGIAVTEKKHLEEAVEALTLITGQKPHHHQEAQGHRRPSSCARTWRSAAR